MSRAYPPAQGVREPRQDRGPTYFTRDGRLYQLRVWSETEWSALPEDGRRFAEHFPGLGWVGGEPVEEACRPRSRPARERAVAAG